MSAPLHEMARQAHTVNWVAAACMATLVYDHVITFGQEVTRIWSMPWRLAKVLFILNRYVVSPMLVFNSIASAQVNPEPDFCVFYLRWLVVTITVSAFVIEGILVLRIWALYENNRLVACSAVFLYFACITTLVGLTIHDYVGEDVIIVKDFAQLPGCYAAAVPKIIAGYWITPVIVESVLFTMTAWRTLNWFRESGSIPPTLRLLARDSMFYFFIIFALLLANLLMFELGPPFLSSLLVTPSNTAGCIAGTRMLLNLRGHAESTARNGGCVGGQFTAETIAMTQRIRFAAASKGGSDVGTVSWRSGVGAGSGTSRATETVGGTPRYYQVRRAGAEDARAEYAQGYSWMDDTMSQNGKHDFEWE